MSVLHSSAGSGPAHWAARWASRPIGARWWLAISSGWPPATAISSARLASRYPGIRSCRLGSRPWLMSSGPSISVWPPLQTARISAPRSWRRSASTGPAEASSARCAAGPIRRRASWPHRPAIGNIPRTAASVPRVSMLPMASVPVRRAGSILVAAVSTPSATGRSCSPVSRAVAGVTMTEKTPVGSVIPFRLRPLCTRTVVSAAFVVPSPEMSSRQGPVVDLRSTRTSAGRGRRPSRTAVGTVAVFIAVLLYEMVRVRRGVVWGADWWPTARRQAAASGFVSAATSGFSGPRNGLSAAVGGQAGGDP